MGKFCTRCGKALQEGEICSCQSGRNSEENLHSITNQSKDQQMNPKRLLGQNTPPQSQLEKQASAFARYFFKKVLEMIKDPITIGKEAIMEGNAKDSVLLMAFQGIISAVFVMVVEGSIMSELDVSTPYARIFMVTWLMSVGLACVLALLLRLGNIIIKISVSYSQMLSAASIRSAVLIPAIILSVIVAIIHMGAGIVLFVLINIWGFTAMVVALSSLIEMEKLNKFVLAVSAVILLFILLAVFAVTKTVRFYIPDEIQTLIRNLSDLEDLFSLF